MKTITLFKIFLLTIFFAFFGFSVKAQVLATSSFSPTTQLRAMADSTITFDSSECIENLSKDKNRFYFRSDYQLVSPVCASFFRVSAFDSLNMVFDGPFKDYRFDSLLLVEGTYKNGNLDGEFVMRYMNGNIWQKGQYESGLMVGSWEYFFPDGKPMYSFTIKDDKLVLNNVWDFDGKQLVKNGNGNAIIYHFNSRSIDNFKAISWRGKVKDGLLEGRWDQYTGRTRTQLNQVYHNGKFVKGYKQGVYFDGVRYFGLGQELALVNAEKLTVSTCEVNPANAFLPAYPKGELNLKDDLYLHFDELQYEKLKSSEITIAFYVDSDGSLSEFTTKSDTGYESHLVKALENLGPWLPALSYGKHVPMQVEFTFNYMNKIEREISSKRNDNKRYKGDPTRQDHHQPQGGNLGQHYFEKDPWYRPSKL
ncbi:toxin-antitoxin system YwqK family antitoxin [Pontibacter vulgaris]|uniref:toxin-antitoxin system YwqK family antitoxin n=1 Tax=Pontibacter vulgaris TaxID=2905679 RepID=UPI001FA75F87|nr:hypothetical protein [Pontibacter vulgaris]